jgi:hypothetical protein
MADTFENIYQPSNTSDGLFVRAYRGDGMVLLAFDIENIPSENFTGFAVKCYPPKGSPYILMNRLNYEQKITFKTKPEERIWTPSDKAPFQKFRWLDVPSVMHEGKYTYEVTAMYLKKDGNTILPGEKAAIEIDMSHPAGDNFEIGFTRGYISSQAYKDKFNNSPIRPKKKSIDFDTSPYISKYNWLGYNARKMIFEFLDECRYNNITVDAFVYDFDEPDLIKLLAKMGGRLRIIMDDARLHTQPKTVPELQAKKIFQKTAGKDKVVCGHFQRFSHDKVFIMKKNGVPVKVLTGSANFSIRGLYVQANNVIVINDQCVASLYEDVFNQAFSDMKGFKKSELSLKWFDVKKTDLPSFMLSFAPHSTADISLNAVSEEIQKANDSVFYAIMEVSGGGKVMDEIRNLVKRKNIFTYGVSQSAKGINFRKSDNLNGIFTNFAFLSDKVPAPFKSEWRGGPGMVIHHKFIVIDFNTTGPVVFTGSSNLSKGGEENNGDNMLSVYDRRIATAYAVEAVRLIDHYNFRSSMKKATKTKPLFLRKGPWWKKYYDNTSFKYQERLILKKR